MNWGHKITIVIITFIVAMLAMVFVAFKQTNEMIDTNYYEKEIKYQNLIDAARNLNKVNDGNIITQTDLNLVIKIPESLLQNFRDGKLELIKNSNEKEDRTFIILPNEKGIFNVSLAKIPSGYFMARVIWTSNNETYYKEQKLNIN